MSYQATNWAMRLRDMKPATKAVLLCLANCHTPDKGCFPSHQRIATDACMSERSVRNHLAELEALGHLRRIKGTGGKRLKGPDGEVRPVSTRYIFSFEEGFEAVDNSSERAESRRQTCVKSRRQNLPTNTVREQLKEEDAREATDSNDFREKVARAVGYRFNVPLPPWWKDKAGFEDHRTLWMDKYGLSETEILEVAAATRKEHDEPPDGPKALDRAMERRWRAKQAAKSGDKRRRHDKRPSAAPAKPVSEHDALKLRAEWLNGDRYVPPTLITNVHVARLLETGMVSPERFRRHNLGHLLPSGAVGSRREAVA